MAIARKLIGILAVSSIGLIALGTSAQNASDDASRKVAPKKTTGETDGIYHDDDWRERNSNGYTAGGTWVSGDPVELNLRKKEGGSHTQEKVQYQDFDFSKRSANQPQSTLQPGSTNWDRPCEWPCILQGTNIRKTDDATPHRPNAGHTPKAKSKGQSKAKARRRN